MKRKLNLSSIVLMLCLIGYVHNAFGQRSIVDPKFIDSFGDLTEVCSAPGDEFMATAILRPGSAMPAGNEYILELSDATGDFTNPVEIGRADGPNNGASNDLTIEFLTVTIPEGTAGDFYRIRVTTTTTSDVSEVSDPLPIYFYRNDLALRINGARDIILCNVSTFSRDLTVDITDIDDGSTVDNNDFEYQWFRGAFPFGTIITGATGPTLTITQSDLDVDGNAAFYAQINLGICNSQFSSARSNNIRVKLIDENPTIIGGPTFNFCPGDMATLESQVENSINAILNYQWFKDGEEIPGAILPTYDIPFDNFEGEYKLEVKYSDDCTLPTQTVTVINEGSSITSPLVGDLIILPTQTITLEITTDAPLAPAATSTFQWFRNGSPLTGALDLTEATVSLDVTTPGEYRIDIAADDDCGSFLTSTSNIYDAIGFDMTIAIADGSDCDDENVTIALEEIVGFTPPASGGPPEIPLTEEQYAFFDFEWFTDNNPTGTTTTSIDISTSDQGAIYRLDATLISGGFDPFSSNEVSLIPIPADIAIVVSSTELPATLSVLDNPNYTYQWFQVVNGEDQEIVGETGNTIVVTEEGEYAVLVSSGICERRPSVVIGPPIGPSAIIPNVVTPNSDNINDNWLLPNDLVGQQDVEVTIYNSRGELDFSGTSYQNNWPSENSASQGQNSTYYYIITKNSTVVRKGSITVVR